MPTVFVTGMSGTGKSSALAELGRRGHGVVDTDSRDWSEWFPADGEWRWREDRIAGLLAADDGRLRYLCGCQSNQGVFYDRFAAVVLLSAPLEVILERVEARVTNDYGKGPQERADIVENLRAIDAAAGRRARTRSTPPVRWPTWSRSSRRSGGRPRRDD